MHLDLNTWTLWNGADAHVRHPYHGIFISRARGERPLLLAVLGRAFWLAPDDRRTRDSSGMRSGPHAETRAGSKARAP